MAFEHHKPADGENVNKNQVLEMVGRVEQSALFTQLNSFHSSPVAENNNCICLSSPWS